MILDFLESYEQVPADDTLDFASRYRLQSLVRDRDVIRRDSEDAERAVELMKEVQKAIGVLHPLHGQVSHDRYGETK